MRPPHVAGFRFGLLSADDVKANSVAEVTKSSLKSEKGSVYDPRLGPVGDEEPGTKCPTCNGDKWKCPGHFGHIDLAVPVIVFYKEATAWAKKCCHSCGCMLVAGPRAPPPAPYATCPHCGVQQPVVKLTNPQDPTCIEIVAKRKNGTKYVLDPSAMACIFDRVEYDDVVKYFGSKDVGEFFHPRKLVVTRLPVMPPCCRPRARQWPAGGAQDDNLSMFLAQIVKINNKIKATPAPLPPDREAEFNQMVEALKLKILCFVDNSKGKAVHATNRKPMVGVKERISKKTGILRQNMMGKRRDQTGRSVVGPDGTLALDEVGVPWEIARNLTVSVKVAPYNVAQAQKLLNDGHVAAVTREGVKYKTDVALCADPIDHGDILENVETGDRRVVTDCKWQVPAGWRVLCRDTEEPKNTDCHKREFTLRQGDEIERYLMDGDVVVVNRQPTLHRNSMLGMKTVVKPGKTIRLNLAVTAGFNMDFDGDEGNLYLPQSEAARAECTTLMHPSKVFSSARCCAAEIFPVQDGVLGSYLLSDPELRVRRDDYMQCLEAIGRSDAIHDGPSYRARDLLTLLLPQGFNNPFESKRLTKTILKKIIRLVFLEHGGAAAATFVDGVHFLTNAWLGMFPFSVGYRDCLLRGGDDTIDSIKRAVWGQFVKAESAYRLPPAEREREVSAALAGARDAGQIVAKSALSSDNRMAVMAEAGSKGDYFNLTQISGLLGQQYVDGRRPGFETDNGKRTLPHYHRVHASAAVRYESRGFIASSFVKGLNPRELFFHAKSGREGMISTSQLTGVTGYAERRMVKLNEDLKIAYDGTVRDASKNIVQFVYGGNGLDPQKCYSDGNPVCYKRLAAELAADGPRVTLDLLTFDLLAPAAGSGPPGAPDPVKNALIQSRVDRIVAGALAHPVSVDALPAWLEKIKTAYAAACATPGEAVGILCAQSIGAKQTQQTLDVFHRAGNLLNGAGHRRFGELLNLPQKPKRRSCAVALKGFDDCNVSQVRDAIGCSLVRKSVRSLLAVGPLKTSIGPDNVGGMIVLDMDQQTCFDLRISPDDVAQALAARFEPPCFETETYFFGVTLKWIGALDEQQILKDITAVKVGGTAGIESYQLYEDPTGPTRWTAVTEGSNLKALLAHSFAVPEKCVSDDVWDVYRALGLAAARRRLRQLMTACVGEDVHPAHVKLLVDRMTCRGRPTPVDRYTMRTCAVGPLSRAAFEESLDILTGAAVTAERETCSGVAAGLVAGALPAVGTGSVSIRVIV